MFGTLGFWEIALIFVVILLLFGAKRLPEMAQGLGKGIREFRKAVKDTTDEIKGSVDMDQQQSTPPRDKEIPHTQQQQPKPGPEADNQKKENG